MGVSLFWPFICVSLLPCLDYLPSYDLLMSMTGGGFSACCLSTFDPIWGVEQWLAPLFGVCPSGSCLEFCAFWWRCPPHAKGFRDSYPCFLTILCKAVSLVLLLILGILKWGGGKLMGNVYAYHIRAKIRENCIYCTFSYCTLFGSLNVYCPLFHFFWWWGTYHLSVLWLISGPLLSQWDW